jgi:hypothetical protein
MSACSTAPISGGSFGGSTSSSLQHFVSLYRNNMGYWGELCQLLNCIANPGIHYLWQVLHHSPCLHHGSKVFMSKSIRKALLQSDVLYQLGHVPFAGRALVRFTLLRRSAVDHKHDRLAAIQTSRAASVI